VGVRLYFLTLLYHVLLFLVGFFLYSLYALITNVNASSTSLPTQRKNSKILQLSAPPTASAPPLILALDPS
jgi:hypothetical protein